MIKLKAQNKRTNKFFIHLALSNMLLFFFQWMLMLHISFIRISNLCDSRVVYVYLDRIVYSLEFFFFSFFYSSFMLHFIFSFFVLLLFSFMFSICKLTLFISNPKLLKSRCRCHFN